MIQVIESWDLTSIGIIAELRHQLDGLPSGFIIKSQTTGKEWVVKKRVLFYHTFDKQKQFVNETITYNHYSFESVDNMLISAKNILEKEEQNIFQYQLQSLGKHFKPTVGETLVPVMIDKFACPCCGYKTFDNVLNGSYEICPVCFWEDDPLQFNNPEFEGGANRMSLRQAQRNFREFGACSREMLSNVRLPRKDEQRDENWKPLNK
jgi:hypothetical protein